MERLTDEQIAEGREKAEKASKGTWSRLEDSGDIVLGLIEQNGGYARYTANICRMEGESEISADEIFDHYYNGEPPCDEDGEPLEDMRVDEKVAWNWPFDGDFIAWFGTHGAAALEELEALRKERKHVLATIQRQLAEPISGDTGMLVELCTILEDAIR